MTHLSAVFTLTVKGQSFDLTVQCENNVIWPGIHQPIFVLESQVCDFQISININQEQLQV